MAKNRDYFDVYFPEPSVSSSSRYFFFNSLRDTQLGGAVMNVLNSYGNQLDFSNKDTEGYQIITNAMNFLKRMIEAEQDNERNYFTINIINNNKLPQELREECQKALGGVIDYKKFINTINEYYDGTLTYKKNLAFEIKRLTELENLYREFNKYYKADINGNYSIEVYDKKSQTMKNKDVNFYSAFNNFLQTGFKRGLISKEQQNFGFNTKTLANTIQSELKSIFNSLWKNIDFRSRLLPYVMEYGLQNFQKQFTSELITAFSHEALPKIIDMLDDPNLVKYKLSGADKQALIKDFLDKMEKTPGNSSTEKISNNFLQTMISQHSELLNEQERLNYNNNRIIRAIKNTTEIKAKKGGGLDNLNPEIIDLLQTLLQERTKQASSNIAWDNKDLYKALIEAFPDEEIKVHGKYNWEKMAALLNKELEGQELVTVNIAAKDNILSESMNRVGLSEAILSDDRVGEAILTFGIQKADVAGIEIGTIEIKQANIPWGQIASKLTHNFISTLDISDSVIETPTFSFDETRFRKWSNFGKTEFSIAAETMRRLALKERELAGLRKELEEAQHTATEIEQILSSLKNNVQIGSTVKSYNKYDSKKGFHGGSLGGTVENQLKNIYQLFQYGGIENLPNQEWLTFAIYNSGPGLLGSDLKEPIEDLLSTVVVMLMFDDVGQQVVYLNEQMMQRYNLNQHNSSRFLHLYNLNGTYYPASFILQLTYNKLTEIFSILELDKLAGTAEFDDISNGSRAEIHNPVSEMVEIGTQVGRDIVTTEQDQWKQTFKANQKSVSINITFLAGMLDIIKILNSSL